MELDSTGEVTLNRYLGDLPKVLWRGSAGRPAALLTAEVTPDGIVPIVDGRRGPKIPVDPATLPVGPHEIGMILAGRPSEVYLDDLTLTACE